MKIYERLSISKQMNLLSIFAILGWILLVAEMNVTAATVLTSIILAIIILLLSFTLGRFSATRALKTVKALHSLASGDLNQNLNIAGRDEFAWLAYEYNCARNSFREIIKQVHEGSAKLASEADELAKIADKTKEGMSKQNSETEQVATAMEEMTCSVREITENAAKAALETQDCNKETEAGNSITNKTAQMIKELSSDIENTATIVKKLNKDCIKIGQVLEVIKEISEQTNLLALNAAIEAARAGDQGRGFAVVADEVRTLARRARNSTEEIRSMIEQIQHGATLVENEIENGCKKASISVENVILAGQSIQNISISVKRISEINTYIAIATKEQSNTAEYINKNISVINNIACDTSSGVTATTNSTESLMSLSGNLKEIVDKFQI